MPANFPPESVLEIGQGMTAARLGVTAAFATTPLLTAPTTGLYQLGLLCRFIATDGAGTVQLILFTPHGPPNTTLRTVPAIPSNGDAAMNAQTCWLNAGDSLSVQCVTTALGATVFNIYLLAFRIF